MKRVTTTVTEDETGKSTSVHESREYRHGNVKIEESLYNGEVKSYEISILRDIYSARDYLRLDGEEELATLQVALAMLKGESQ